MCLSLLVLEFVLCFRFSASINYLCLFLDEQKQNVQERKPICGEGKKKSKNLSTWKNEYSFDSFQQLLLHFSMGKFSPFFFSSGISFILFILKWDGNEQITLINQYNGYLLLFRLKLAGCTTSCLSAQAAWKLFLLLLKRYEKIQN